MRVEKRDSSKERKILIGMITDTGVVSRLSERWSQSGLFPSKYANLLGTWCMEYHEKYGTAPGKQIQGIFENWAEDAKDRDTVDAISRLLEQLSGQYAKLKKESNTDWILDTAGEFFNRVALQKLVDRMQGALDSGDTAKALKRYNDFTAIEIGKGSSIDVFKDDAALQDLFAEDQDDIVHYKGALKTFYKEQLTRDAFIGFMGPEKRGKTFHLQDIAWTGMESGRKVAFFEVGDMSQRQIMRRFMARAAGRPFKAGTVEYPTFLEVNWDMRTVQVDREERVYENRLTYNRARKACDKIIKKHSTGEPLFRLDCYPNSTINVKGIQYEINKWYRQLNWHPDVICVDYADILAPMHGGVDSREQINATWKALRALSQKEHCLVVTATQSDTASYKAATLDKTNFSEDKRKFAHVTGMVGINQTMEEKEQGVQRYNWLVLREDEFIEQSCCYLAGCLGIAHPTVLSAFQAKG